MYTILLFGHIMCTSRYINKITPQKTKMNMESSTMWDEIMLVEALTQIAGILNQDWEADEHPDEHNEHPAADERPADEHNEHPADTCPADEHPADPADERPANERPADEHPADPADERPADTCPAAEHNHPTNKRKNPVKVEHLTVKQARPDIVAHMGTRTTDGEAHLDRHTSPHMELDVHPDMQIANNQATFKPKSSPIRVLLHCTVHAETITVEELQQSDELLAATLAEAEAIVIGTNGTYDKETCTDLQLLFKFAYRLLTSIDVRATLHAAVLTLDAMMNSTPQTPSEAGPSTSTTDLEVTTDDHDSTLAPLPFPSLTSLQLELQGMVSEIRTGELARVASLTFTMQGQRNRLGFPSTNLSSKMAALPFEDRDLVTSVVTLVTTTAHRVNNLLKHTKPPVRASPLKTVVRAFKSSTLQAIAVLKPLVNGMIPPTSNRQGKINRLKLELSQRTFPTTSKLDKAIEVLKTSGTYIHHEQCIEVMNLLKEAAINLKYVAQLRNTFT